MENQYLGGNVKTTFYNKFFSGLSISFISSFLISKFIFKSNIYFIFSLSFFGALYLLFSWLTYLKLDGLFFFNKKTNKTTKKILDFRFSYKKKGVYNIDKDYDTKEHNALSEDKILKATIYGYLFCGLILLIGSQFIYNR